MASLTIRNLDEETKKALRYRAARNGVSMEQEARVILRNAVRSHDSDPPRPVKNLYDSIRELVDKYGPFDLEIPPREPIRDPPAFD